MLLTSKKILKPDTKVVGDTPLSPFGDKEIEDYIELLSACNITFDIKYHDELSFDDIISNEWINYSTIILTLPEKQLSEENINTIKKVSHDFGVSIIASYNRTNKRTKQLFGIDRIKGRRFSFPCTISIYKNKLIDSRIESEIKLGDGWKIPLQRWGLRRHPIRYIKQHFKKFYEQVFFYMKVEALPGAESLSVIKGTTAPAILRYQYGKAMNFYIALHSDFFLDRFNSLHRIVREFIRQNSGSGMVSFDLADTMVLRMDDPGTCERVYLKGYDTKILGKEDWKRMLELLRKYRAKLSVMYVPLWVDDGNLENGRLFIKGKEVTDRKGGAIYHSKDVSFVKNNGNNNKLAYDYVREFDALKEGLISGNIDIESHGLTHVDTNLDRWLDAKDRYSNLNWYISEFRHVCDNQDSAEEEQAQVLQESARKIEEFFGISPSAIAPSGHEQSKDSEQIAHANGYKLFSSDYNSIYSKGPVIRNDKIRSIFFEQTKPDFSFSHSGYPLIGVFHDDDIVKRGMEWLDEIIKGWKEKGINKFITLRELVGYLCSSVEAYQEDNNMYIEVNISKTGGVSNTHESRYFFKHRMVIYIKVPKGKVPKAIEIEGKVWEDYEYYQPQCQVRLTLPPFRSKDEHKILVTFESFPVNE